MSLKTLINKKFNKPFRLYIFKYKCILLKKLRFSLCLFFIVLLRKSAQKYSFKNNITIRLNTFFKLAKNYLREPIKINIFDNYLSWQ